MHLRSTWIGETGIDAAGKQCPDQTFGTIHVLTFDVVAQSAADSSSTEDNTWRKIVPLEASARLLVTTA